MVRNEWVRNKSCQPDLHFSEQTDVAGGTTTLQVYNISTQLKGGGSTRNVGLLRKM